MGPGAAVGRGLWGGVAAFRRRLLHCAAPARAPLIPIVVEQTVRGEGGPLPVLESPPPLCSRGPGPTVLPFPPPTPGSLRPPPPVLCEPPTPK